MSDFDISIGAEPEEKEIRVSCKLLSDSQYARLQSYVDAVNSVRRSKGAKDVDYKYLLPTLIMRGIDTEQTELPEHLLKKVKATRKRRISDDEAQPMAQAAE
jgi:hypothetical protein